MKNILIHDFKFWSDQYKKQLITNHFQNDSDLLKALNSKQKEQLISGLQIRSFQRGQTIYVYGQKPVNIYVLIKGEALVLNLVSPIQQVNEQKKTILKNIVYIQQNKHKSFYTKQSYLEQYLNKQKKQGYENKKVNKLLQIKQLNNLSINQIKNIKQLFDQQGNIKVKIFVKLTHGIFGQQQIQTNYKTTILCSQNCLMVQIPIQLYKKILKSRIQQRQHIKMQFFQTLLKNICNKHIIEEFSKLWILRRLSENQFLFRENQSADFIYIILNGQVQIQKNVDNKQKMNKKKQKKRLKISKLSDGEILGDCEVIQKKSHYFDARVKSQFVEVFQVSCKQFLKIIKQYYTLRTYFNEMITKKRQNREELLKKIQKIPIQIYENNTNIQSVSIRNDDFTNRLFKSKKSLYQLPQISKITSNQNRIEIISDLSNPRSKTKLIKSLSLKIPEVFKIKSSSKNQIRQMDKIEPETASSSKIISSGSHIQSPTINKFVKDLYYQLGEGSHQNFRKQRSSHRILKRKY